VGGVAGNPSTTGGTAGGPGGDTGGSAAGADTTAGAAGTAGESQGGAGGVVVPPCVSPNWLDCPSCTADGDPGSGSCTYGPGDPLACYFDSGTTTGLCQCTYAMWFCSHDCGTEPPAQGTPCEELPPPGDNVCYYSNQICTCEAPGRWNCGCPVPVPTDGTSCPEYDGMDCDYSSSLSGDRCICNATSGNWDCLVCPSDKPTHDTDCTGFPATCDYADGPCQCDPETNLWSCTQDCVTPPVASGDSCNGISDWCPAADTQCQCDTTTSTWNCVTCDEIPPLEGSGCGGLAALECPYYDAHCTCDAAETWTCEGICPPPVPTDGVTCSDPAIGVFCIYPDANDPAECVCDGSTMQWRCLDCPASTPTPGDPCTGYYGRECAYADGRCACDTASNTWDCVDCPASQPAEDSSCTGLARLTCQYGAGSCTCNSDTLLWLCR
jgi:hypothetical protein